MAGAFRAVGRYLRQPEYVGENRCLPCTVVNVLLAALSGVTGALVVSVFTAPILGVVTGGLLVVGALATIYFRGYLVPGTPRLAELVMPRPVRQTMHRTVTDNQDQDDGAVISMIWKANGERSAGNAILESGHVLIRDGGSHRPTLDEAFREEWLDGIAAIRRDTDQWEALVGEYWYPDAITRPVQIQERSVSHRSERPGRKRIQVYGPKNRLLSTWDGEAAFIADLAAVKALRGWISDWEGIDASRRGELAFLLRPFLSTCPRCDEPLRSSVSAVSSCCTDESRRYARRTCGRCEETLVRVPVSDEE